MTCHDKGSGEPARVLNPGRGRGTVQAPGKAGGRRPAGTAAMARVQGVGITAGGSGIVATRQAPDARAAPRHDMVRHRVHTVSSLERRERWWAAAVVLALVAAPVVAVLMFVPGWTPASDPALMGMRALDVGTANTPLLGQPSQSRLYAGTIHSVHHPGPLHFYLMALPIRVLGAPLAMPLVSLLITGSCLTIAVWAVFRQLGRTAGLAAAALLALVAFTTGPSSLVHPVSSNIAGYPLLCTAVLWWCVAVGDVRLLPLATAVASFTAQQHLSVVPATTVLVLGALALLAVRWWRAGHWREPAHRHDLRRWGVSAAGLGLVLWSPVIAQQVFSGDGNLGEMLWFARHGNSDTLGPGNALRQVANVVGLPPVLGRTHLVGGDLLLEPSVLRWISTLIVLGGATALCLRWRRHGSRLASLGLGIGLVLAAGLVNGSSVPRGVEQGRLSFYHWAWPLTLMTGLVYALAVAPVLTRAATRRWTAARPALAGLTVVAVALPTAVNPALDRPANTAQAAGSPVDVAQVRRLADAVEAEADRLGEHVLLTSRGEPVFTGLTAALGLELAQRGIDVRWPANQRYFIHDARLVDREQLDGGLMLLFDSPLPLDPPAGGELLAEVTLAPGFDAEAYGELVAAASQHDEVVLGPEGERAVDRMGSDKEAVRAYVDAFLDDVVDNPRRAFLNPAILEFVRDHPLEQPVLDPEAVERVLDGLDVFDSAGPPIGRMHLYLLDGGEMAELAYPPELDRSPDDR